MDGPGFTGGESMNMTLGRFHRWIIALGLLLALPSLSAGPVVAAGPVTMNVSLGLNGWARYGSWLPVDVELTNEGSDLDARVVVDAGTGETLYGNGAGPYRTDYAVDVSLPQHSHKLVH